MALCGGHMTPAWAGSTKYLLCPGLEYSRYFEGVQGRGKNDLKESHKTVMKALRARGSCTFKVKSVY